MASAEDEQSLRASVELYKSQLLQVEASLQSNDSVAIEEDLRQLQNDLKEIIKLTQDAIESKRLSREHFGQNAAFPGSSQYFDNHVSSSIDSEFSNLVNNYGNNADDSLDEEYVAFQNLLGEHLTRGTSTERPGQTPENKDATTEDSDQSAEEIEEGDEGDYDTSGEDDEGREFSGDSSQDDDMFGQKCQAPFCRSWGPMSYHNAIILSRVQNDSSTHEPEVEVFFCNPTHISMQPCPYFLAGCCHFDSTACKYSHGEHVKISDLRPYQHPDFSNLGLETKCLARDDDNIWYEAVIVEILEDSHFQIQFEANHQLKSVSITDIFPIECQTDDTSLPAIDDDGDPNSQDYTVSSLPSLLTEMPDLQTTDALGQWEMHTKGIGSKLMAKMGYVVGQGLGRNNEGRAVPVPINLLPKGITLDKIMELKSVANNDDLFNAMKKQKRKNKQQNHKKSKATSSHKTFSPSVFNFINSKLHQSKGPGKSSMKCRTLRTAKDTKFISAHELKDKSDKHLNIQLLKTNEEIKNTERQIRRLQDSLERAVERHDHDVSKEIRRKLDSLNGYTNQLKTSESFIKNQKKNRKAHDLLTKF